MNQQILKNIIVEGQELLGQIKAQPRNFAYEPSARYVFVGVRQAGKSYLLYLRAQELIAQGHDPREMLFVNFDDQRLIGFRAEEFDDILQAYAGLYSLRPILFLDEIQNVEGWEHFARRLANQRYTVYITGSNAKMLSRDIASTLGARYMEQRVFPYSFKEFLRANGCQASAEGLFGSAKGEADRLLDVYFRWGGFPELMGIVDKRRWLNELYEKIILGDILQRNGIRNDMAMRLAMRRLAENVKTPVSFNRLADLIRATGVKTNVASVIDYVGQCQDACLTFSIENFASKFVERATIRKHYFTDNGLLSIFLTDNETALLENLCMLTLYRDWKADGGSEVCYYKKEMALDAYLPELKKGIQISYSLADPATQEREVKALTSFHEKFGLNAAEIVTFSEERTIEASGLTINVVPLAKWLLRFRS